MERTQPWQYEALQLLQEMYGKLQELWQKGGAVLPNTTRLVIEALIEEVRREEKQASELLE